MADVKISALPLASTPLAGTEVLPIVQSATTDQVTVANLTAGRAVSASSLTLTTTPLAAGSGGTGITSLGTGVATTLGNAINGASGFCVQDASGNLGLGVTPSAWGTNQKGFQIANFASLWSDENAASARLGGNVYQSGNSTYNYKFAGVAASMYNVGGGVHQWFTTGTTTGSAGGAITFTQAMTLDASGNLALNTTTNGITTQGTGIFTVNGSTGFGQFCIAGDNAIHGPNAGYIIGNTNSNTFISGIKFNAGSASSGDIGFFVNGNTGTNAASVTIDASGNLLVGTTTAVGRLTVQGPTSGTMAVSITKPNGLSNAVVLNSGTTTTDPCILVQGNGTSTAYWLHNGDIYLPGGTAGVKTFSDIKLKRNVTYLDNQTVSGYRGLSEILQLKPVTYNFKSDSDEATPRKGFVAQDFEQIFPELVSASKIPGDKAEVEYKHISDGGLIPVLVSAIQELAAKVQALEAKVQ